MRKDFIGLTEPHISVVVGSEESFIEFAFKIFRSEPGIVSRIIKGENCSTLDVLFKEFASVLDFPSFFGSNWGAMDELLNDLSWIPAKGYGLLISNMDRVLTEDKEGFAILIKVLQRAADEWVSGRSIDEFPTFPTPFKIVFHCLPRKYDQVVKRLMDAAIRAFETIHI